LTSDLENLFSNADVHSHPSTKYTEILRHVK